MKFVVFPSIDSHIKQRQTEHGRLRSSDGQDMDEMRFGYGQTAVYSRPGRKIDEKQGWNTSLMMVMMMDGREAQGIMTGQVILRRRRTRCVRLHDMIGAIGIEHEVDRH